METLDRSQLPGDLRQAVDGLNVSDEMVRRYCCGPRVEHTVARAAVHEALTPDAPERRTAVAVLDLEQLIEA